MFEPSPFESQLIENKIFEGEVMLTKKWKSAVDQIIIGTQLHLPDWSSVAPILGGRNGQHSEFLQPMLDEMSEVFNIDPTAEW